LSKIINAVRMLSDRKTREWMEQENNRLNKEIADINAGKISQTLSQEDIGHIQHPKQITVPTEFDDEGNVIGTRIEDYDFGKMNRMIQDKRRELAKVKEKYRKKSAVSTFFRK